MGSSRRVREDLGWVHRDNRAAQVQDAPGGCSVEEYVLLSPAASHRILRWPLVEPGSRGMAALAALYNQVNHALKYLQKNNVYPYAWSVARRMGSSVFK